MAFHNCKLFTWSVYMVMSDTSCMIDGLPLLYWHQFGQVWARFNIEQCAKYHTTLDNIVGIGNRITYNFGRDRTTAQLCSCLRLQLHGAIYCPDSFETMLRYCVNLKVIRYESTILNRIVADKSHRVIVA